ncbi:MAG: hypothetical protein NZ898_15800 [Myxococcota bacterium]|nr:hypothetical protein [Myxococcota bacterium]
MFSATRPRTLDPLARIREAIDRGAAALAADRRERARGLPGSLDPAVTWLAGEQAVATLDEAVGLRLVDESEHGAIAAWLAFAAAYCARRDARAGAMDLDAIDRDASRLVDAIGEARLRTEARMRGRPRGPDAGPPDADLAKLARGFLDATDEAGAAAAEWIRRIPWPEGLEAASAASRWAARLCASVGAEPARDPRERLRRSALRLSVLGVERHLERSATAEVGIADGDPRPRVVALDPPRRLSIVVRPDAEGAPAELAALEAVGRAAAFAVRSVALPPERRWPRTATSARALGVAFAQLAADPVYAARMRIEAGDRITRTAAAVLAQWARMTAARVAWPLPPGTRRGAAFDELYEGVRRAVGDELPPALVAVLGADVEAARTELRGLIAGLALAHRARDLFDEDWFRNPRAAELVARAGERGDGLSAEALLEELGAVPEAAARRLAELVLR